MDRSYTVGAAVLAAAFAGLLGFIASCMVSALLQSPPVRGAGRDTTVPGSHQRRVEETAPVEYSVPRNASLLSAGAGLL